MDMGKKANTANPDPGELSGGTPARASRKKAATAKASLDIPPEDAHVSLSLLKYFYWIELGIRSYLRSRNNVEFSRGEGLVIASLMLGYSRPSDIARQLGVSRQATHVTIQQMKKKGIVDLSPDPDDGRIKQVVLTPLAKKMNDDGTVAMNLIWQELGRRLGKADLVRTARVLTKDWGPPVVFDGDDQMGDPSEQ